MSITIQLSPELEEKLRQFAAETGLDIDQYVVELLKKQLQPGPSAVLSKEERERDLLEKINLGISPATWKRYNYLKLLRDKEQLDPEEHAELIPISDQIEEANAARIKYVVELAQLRQASLEDVVRSLGLQSGSNA
jgi:hypothetical protein